jgi:DNA-binding transcriptional ArsR family regulator
MDASQESTLTYALLTEPARVGICRALLEAGDDGVPAAELAASLGLSLPRASRVFQELLQADILALTIRDRRVVYSLKARREVREALGYLDSSGLLS